MPSRPDPAIDERFDELASELRAARPQPSAALRERVLALADRPVAAPRPWFLRARPSFRPALAVAAAAGVAAVAVGIASQRDGGHGASEDAVTGVQTATPELQREPGEAADATTATPAAPSVESRRGATPPPSGTRLQDYRAELRVRVASVEELSVATARAMRTARSLGGYVVTARFDAPPGDEGDSLLVFRVPVSRVQEAIVRLTALGSLVSQRIALEDLQAPLERQTDAIAELRTRVRALERSLRTRGLAEEERARLQLELMQTRQQLADQVRQRAETLERGRLALLSLTLTTRDDGGSVPSPPGETERRLRDAVGALGDMLSWLLYAAIVASPFLVLAAIGAGLERRRRRRANERLLERA